MLSSSAKVCHSPESEVQTAINRYLHFIMFFFYLKQIKALRNTEYQSKAVSICQIRKYSSTGNGSFCKRLVPFWLLLCEHRRARYNLVSHTRKLNTVVTSSYCHWERFLVKAMHQTTYSHCTLLDFTVQHSTMVKFCELTLYRSAWMLRFLESKSFISHGNIVCISNLFRFRNFQWKTDFLSFSAQVI